MEEPSNLSYVSTIYGVMHHVEGKDASHVKAAKDRKRRLMEKKEKEEGTEKEREERRTRRR